MSASYKVPFSPTGNFFLRDIAYFLILILISQNSQNHAFNSSSESVRNLIDYFMIFLFIFSLTLTMFIKFDQKEDIDKKSWLATTIFNQIESKKSSFIPHDTNTSVGVVFTRDAYQQIRNGGVKSIWMPTDVLDSRTRLLTAITKIQPKDPIFSSPNGIFQASTVSDFNWCAELNRNKYWIDYVVFASNESRPKECGNNILMVDNLWLVKVNPNLGSYIVPIALRSNDNSNRKVPQGCTVNEYAYRNDLELVFSKCKLNPELKYTMTLPYLNFSNLKLLNYDQKSFRIDNKKNILKIDINNQQELEQLRFTMLPNLNVKLTIIFLWFLNFYLHFRIAKSILMWFKSEN
jgi:hypothetical protein